MKKMVSILLLIIIIFSTLTSNFVYADNDELYLSSGKILQGLGILVGDGTGDLRLEENLKRQDMIVLLSRLYKDEDKAKNFLAKAKFKDIPEGDKFYGPYIAWAVDKMLIKGMDKDNFGFDMNMTVQEFQTVLLRALGYIEESGLWSAVPKIANTLGIMNDLDIKPKDQLSRGQMAAMTLNTLKLTKKGSTLTLAEVLGIELDPDAPVARSIKR
ncbi:MAG: S-layer homology domain-containing protein [Tissierellia bacterium]|nr:S-layer homology domain-containing protein [Tissierellia bacterium]